jgi:hypothetical protein
VIFWNMLACKVRGGWPPSNPKLETASCQLYSIASNFILSYFVIMKPNMFAQAVMLLISIRKVLVLNLDRGH